MPPSSGHRAEQEHDAAESRPPMPALGSAQIFASEHPPVHTGLGLGQRSCRTVGECTFWTSRSDEKPGTGSVTSFLQTCGPSRRPERSRLGNVPGGNVALVFSLPVFVCLSGARAAAPGLGIGAHREARHAGSYPAAVRHSTSLSPPVGRQAHSWRHILALAVKRLRSRPRGAARRSLRAVLTACLTSGVAIEGLQASAD